MGSVVYWILIKQLGESIMLFYEIRKMDGYKVPQYQVEIDRNYYPRSFDRWDYQGYRGSYNDVRGVASKLSGQERRYGSNKGDQLWLHGFHPMDDPFNNPLLCSHCGAFHSA